MVSETASEEDPTDGMVTTMIIFCSVAFVFFSIIYAICWYRGSLEKKKALARQAAIAETSPTEHSGDNPIVVDDDDEENGGGGGEDPTTHGGTEEEEVDHRPSAPRRHVRQNRG